MADVDTSSYPRLPANPPSFLDTAGKFANLANQGQQLQSNQLTIQRQKLDLINQQFSAISSQMAGLIAKPDLNENDITNFYQGNVKEGRLTPDLAATEIGQIPPTQGMKPQQAAQVLKNFMSNKLSMGQSTIEAINWHLGQHGWATNNQQTQPTLTSNKPGFGGLPQGGVIATQPGIQMQPPPTQPTIAGPNSGLPQGTPTILGPTNTSPLPVGPRNVQGQISGMGNVTGATVGPDQPNMGQPGLPTQRITQNQPIQTGLAPGVAEPMQASGQQLANDRLAAANYQRDIFPLMQAIPALEKLGTKGTGPGTETIQELKSFVLSNVPGVKESMFDGTVKDFDEAKKYLTDFVNQTGNSGTNDKLAAAFAGNPSVHISNAAAVDVAKSALALRRMKQAQLLTFEQTGLPDNQYSKWVAQTTNQLDPRAFGVDMMTPKAQAALKDQLTKNPNEAKSFAQSLRIAHNLNFLTPSQPTNAQ